MTLLKIPHSRFAPTVEAQNSPIVLVLIAVITKTGK
jgi:hypothetical protein